MPDSEYRGIVVHCETLKGNLTSIATELLGGGRELADELEVEVSALLIGSDVAGLASEAIAFGADRVYVVDDPLLTHYQTDPYVSVTEKVVKLAMPEIIILGQTDVGRDLGPRLAFRLGTTATLGCMELAIAPETKRLLQTKPVYGGNAQAVFISETSPQIATVRGKVMSPIDRDASRHGEVTMIDPGLDPSRMRTRLLEIKEELEGIKLEDAPVIVSGGRGIGSADGFKQLEDLAKMLKGAVGASRPPCDNEWVPSTLQIGLTGKNVAPDLYIAVALSGANQHMTGCSAAKTIVAINSDPDANIFREAHFGVVGDWKKVLPGFRDKIKEMTGD